MLAVSAASASSQEVLAQATRVKPAFVNGKRSRLAFRGKRPLIIVLTSRLPRGEKPFEVFNDGLIAPNDAFLVRYHNAGKVFDLTLADLRCQFKPVEHVAVNQCSGNSCGFMSPRVTGGQLGNGALGECAAERVAGARRA